MNKAKENVYKVFLKLIKNYYMRYSFLFFFFFVGAFGIFWWYGKAPIWDSDAISQHYPNFIYVRSWILDMINDFTESGNFEMTCWDSTIGLGQDVFNVVSFRPSTLLAVFFTKSSIVTYIWITIAVRIYLVGLVFSKYCFFMKVPQYPTLVATMLYSFGSYVLVYGTKHYMFVDMLLFLPLLCLGLEKIIQKNKAGTFIFGVFLSAWTYFYMLYVVALFVVIYFLIRYFAAEGKKNVKGFLFIVIKCGLNGILGLFLASFSLLPSLFLTFESSRYGETVEKTYTNFLHYSRDFYLEFFTHIFTPQYMYLGLVLGISGLAGIAVLFLFLQKKKNDMKIGVLMVFTMLALPMFSYIFNAFSGYNLRWSCGLSFLLCIIVAVLFPELFNMSAKKLILMWIFVGGYIITTILLYFCGVSINYGGIFSVWLFAVLITIFYLKPRLYLKIMGRGIILFAVFFEVFIKSVSLYSPYGENYLDQFYNSSTVEQEVEALNSKAVKAIDDDSVYRVDEIDSDFFSYVYNRNYGQRVGVNGLSSFYSYSPGSIKQYMQDMGIAQQPTPFCILGMTHRTALNTLNSVKYATTYEFDDSRIPFGYEYKDTVQITDVFGNAKDVYVYENLFALPYAYVYDSYIPYESYKELNALEKEQAMLQGVVLEEEIEYPISQTKNNSTTVLSKEEILKQISEKYSDSGDIRITERGITTLKDQVSITLDFSGIDNAETYVWLNDLEYVPMVPTLYQDHILGANADKLTQKQFQDKYRFWDPPTSSRIIFDNYQTIYLNDEFAQYYSGAVEAVGNLGYSAQAKNQVTITFSTIGEYNFSDIQVVAYSMDDYVNNVMNLQKNVVDDIKITNNSVKGTIDVDQTKFVCVNIPKSNGWKAFVNGKETKLYSANGMYMGMLVPPGENEITLVYQTPGLKVGLVLTILSTIVLIIVKIIVVLWKIRKNNSEKLTNNLS